MTAIGFIDSARPTPWPFAATLATFLFVWAIGWTWMVFNSLIRLRQRVRQGWSLIDVELKRRHDLIAPLATARSQRASQLGRRRYEMEQRIIGLAFGNDGLLSAGAVSATLRITVNEAKQLLGELVATGRARAETNEETGDASYYFGEAKRTRGIRRNSAL